MVALLVLSLVMFARPAHACGYWSMTDTERGYKIGYLINAASIEKGDKRLAAQYLDIEAKDGLRTSLGKTVVFDIKGGALRKRGKRIGTVDATGATINGTRYTIVLGASAEPYEMPTYTLRVTRADKAGDTEILTSDAASSLCAGIKKSMTDEQSREEVRRRVIYYLAWRATGN